MSRKDEGGRRRVEVASGSSSEERGRNRMDT